MILIWMFHLPFVQQWQAGLSSLQLRQMGLSIIQQWQAGLTITPDEVSL
jgi:hypothetical protein